MGGNATRARVRPGGLLIAIAGALLIALAAASGPHPAPAAAQTVPAPSDSGSLAGRVILLRSGRPEANASGTVVYLPRLSRRTAATAAVVTQHKKAFTPHVLAIPMGATVAFPNLDRIHHNAFSLSESCRFDLGLYKDGESRSRTFDTAGVCRVYCNIHAQMSAIVLVTKGDASMVTASDGAYRLDGLPPGRHVVSLWHERGTPAEEAVEIVGGQTLARDFLIDVSGYKAQSHTRKDGRPYGRDDETRY